MGIIINKWVGEAKLKAGGTRGKTLATGDIKQ